MPSTAAPSHLAQPWSQLCPSHVPVTKGHTNGREHFCACLGVRELHPCGYTVLPPYVMPGNQDLCIWVMIFSLKVVWKSLQHHWVGSWSGCSLVSCPHWWRHRYVCTYVFCTPAWPKEPFCSSLRSLSSLSVLRGFRNLLLGYGPQEAMWRSYCASYWGWSTGQCAY